MKRINNARALRRQATVIFAAVLAGSVIAACSSSASSSSPAGGTTSASTASPSSTGVKKGLVVYFITKDTQNPYEVLADKGGEKALSELGGKVVVSSGTVDTAAAQIPSIQAAIQAHANAIVIAGNDPSALCPSLNQAARGGIISPTTVGISTAAQYLDTHKNLLSHLTLTGLGLPSQMRKYVQDGTVAKFELWNPSNLGYLAGYAAASLASGTASLTPGSTFKGGTLGTYTVLPPAAGTGPSVVLGPPTVFDKANISQFNF